MLFSNTKVRELAGVGRRSSKLVPKEPRDWPQQVRGEASVRRRPRVLPGAWTHSIKSCDHRSSSGKSPPFSDALHHDVIALHEWRACNERTCRESQQTLIRDLDGYHP